MNNRCRLIHIHRRLLIRLPPHSHTNLHLDRHRPRNAPLDLSQEYSSKSRRIYTPQKAKRPVRESKVNKI
jgi:hypothetical protein